MKNIRILRMHPILFAISPILFLFSHNKDQILFRAESILYFAVLSGLFALVLLGLTFLFFREMEKAAIWTSLFVILFFSYGYLYGRVSGFQMVIGNFVFGPHQLLYATCVLSLLLLGYYLYHTRTDLTRFTTFLFLVALFLAARPILDILIFRFSSSQLHPQVSASKDRQPKGSTPDIYYIILDAYPRNDILLEFFGYDNSEFTSYLEGRGFYIASKSTSNYAHSFLSLSPSLNFDYLDHLTDEFGADSKDLSPAFNLVEYNKAAAFLKSEGYKFINIGSGWWLTDYNRYADLNLTRGAIPHFTVTSDEFILTLLQSTALKPFGFVVELVENDIRRKVLNAFDNLAKIPKMPEKTFTFTHIVIPHPGFLFDSDGNPFPRSKLQRELSLFGKDFETYECKNREYFLDQLIFVNKKVRWAVDKILEESETPPIVIIQSDHGPTTILGHPLGWVRPPSEDGLRERLSILNAYYLPDGGKDLYAGISPVNTFRVIFNIYFGTSYQLLPDKSYYSDYSRIYEFLDVSAIVRD